MHVEHDGWLFEVVDPFEDRCCKPDSMVIADQAWDCVGLTMDKSDMRAPRFKCVVCGKPWIKNEGQQPLVAVGGFYRRKWHVESRKRAERKGKSEGDFSNIHY